MGRVLSLMMSLALLSIASAGEKPVSIEKLVKRHSSELGAEVYSFKYKEPGLMEETGSFWGFSGAYTYRPWVPSFEEDRPAIKWMFRAEARFSWGTVDYDGGLYNFETDETTPYTYDNLDDHSKEFRALLGVDFPKETLIDTIYTGLGIRYLTDRLDEAVLWTDDGFDVVGYGRDSRYLYLPIGAKTLRRIAGNWLLTATAEFDLLLRGRQKSGWGPYTLENIQNTGYGLRGAIRFERKGKTADFIIEPFVRYWNIDESEWGTIEGYEGRIPMVEPKNNTTEFGLSLSWMF